MDEGYVDRKQPVDVQKSSKTTSLPCTTPVTNNTERMERWNHLFFSKFIFNGFVLSLALSQLPDSLLVHAFTLSTWLLPSYMHVAKNNKSISNYIDQSFDIYESCLRAFFVGACTEFFRQYSEEDSKLALGNGHSESMGSWLLGISWYDIWIND